MNATMDWFETLPDGRLLCTLCPRACKLHDGDRGFCFVRKREGARINLDTYGKSTGFCIDPIEKKPLNHFLPGTSVLSFGTAGCNLGCKFCQNWDISKSREVARLSDSASPKAIASAQPNMVAGALLSLTTIQSSGRVRYRHRSRVPTTRFEERSCYSGLHHA